nr:hypothetical protein [uncultured Marinifilum sp.]
MKNLEQIFKDHKEEFNDYEPSKAHFENFLSKINQNKKKKTAFMATNFFKVAVILSFVILSGVTGYHISNIQNNQISLGTISPEYQEVELFYTSNIDSQLKMIDRMGTFDNSIHQNILAEELKDMDEKYNQLKTELKLHPDDDRIIEAMIEYYQVKTNILNRIIEQLYQVRKQTKTNLNVSA